MSSVTEFANDEAMALRRVSTVEKGGGVLSPIFPPRLTAWRGHCSRALTT